MKANFVLGLGDKPVVNFLHANGGVYLFFCSLVMVSWKVCCKCVM